MRPTLFIGLTLLLSSSICRAQTADKKSATDVAYAKEIEKLLQKKNVKDAFVVIDQLEPITSRELIMLTEIPAPPFMESVRAEMYKKMLEEAGAKKVWIDSVGNVLALRKGINSKRTIAIDAHLDTVFPEGTDVKVKFKGDTLYAPGVGDDTRGLMVLLTLFRAMEKANIQTREDVLFVGTVGEEGLGDLRGVKYLFHKNSPKIDSWVSIDGEEIGHIYSGGLGSVRYKVTFKGPGGHSWGAFGLGNPHHALGKAIDYFAEEASKFSASGTKASYNVGRIGGGTSVNSIPFESWMEVDMRSEDPERLKKMDEIFKANVNRALTDYNKSIKEGPALTVDIKQVGFRPSGVEDEKLPLIQRSIAAAQYFGAQVTLSTGSTNSNIPISKGIPAVTIGRGGKGDNAHSLNEWWINDKGTDAIKFALIVLLSEAGMQK
jgi:tripeptide aminopeptidase